MTACKRQLAGYKLAEPSKTDSNLLIESIIELALQKAGFQVRGDLIIMGEINFPIVFVCRLVGCLLVCTLVVSLRM